MVLWPMCRCAENVKLYIERNQFNTVRGGRGMGDRLLVFTQLKSTALNKFQNLARPNFISYPYSSSSTVQYSNPHLHYGRSSLQINGISSLLQSSFFCGVNWGGTVPHKLLTYVLRFQTQPPFF